VEGFGELFGYEAEIKALLIRVAGNSAKVLRKSLGVAMLAAGTYLRAAPERVPCRVCPFDFFGMLAHGCPSLAGVKAPSIVSAPFLK
jgi:hypothetical protein